MRLAEYEDTRLTPEEIKTLKKQLNLTRAEVQGLSKKLAEWEKSDTDKERYTIELYNRARKAEEKADYWEKEAKKWCAKHLDTGLNIVTSTINNIITFVKDVEK